MLLPAGPSVSPPIREVVRLNCRSSVAVSGRRRRRRSTAVHRRRRKRIDLVAKQRIVSATAAALAIFVHQRGVTGGTSEDIDDHVVIVTIVVVAILGFVVLVCLVVGVLKVVRVEDAAV